MKHALIDRLTSKQKTDLIKILVNEFETKDHFYDDADMFLNIESIVKNKKIITAAIENYCDEFCNCDDCCNYNLVKFKNNTYNIIPKGMTYGFEIECFINKDIIVSSAYGFVSIKDLFKKADIIKEKLNVKIGSDGSLSRPPKGNRPVEIKTQILSGDKGLDELDKIFSEFKPKFNSSCGIHLHVNRKGIDIDKIRSLSYLFDFIVMPFFTTKERYYNNEFCIKGFGSVTNHYYATSWSDNYETIEFRHMHGHDDIAKIKEFAALVMAILQKTKKMNRNDVHKFVLDVLNYPPSKEKFTALTDGAVDRYGTYMSEHKLMAFNYLKKLVGEQKG